MSLGVTEQDREFAAQILEDLGTFEEGIADQEKLAQWVRNIRNAALRSVAQGAPVAWAILYQVGGTGIWKIVQDQASADFWKKEGFPVQPLAPTNPPPVITSGLVPDKNSASGFRVGSAVTSTERCDGADDLEHLDGMLDDRERG